MVFDLELLALKGVGPIASIQRDDFIVLILFKHNETTGDCHAGDWAIALNLSDQLPVNIVVALGSSKHDVDGLLLFVALLLDKC